MRKSKRSGGGWSSCCLTCQGTQQTVSCGWLAVFLSWFLATILTRDALRTGTASGMRCSPYCPQRRILRAVAVELHTHGRPCTHSVRTLAHLVQFNFCVVSKRNLRKRCIGCRTCVSGSVEMLFKTVFPAMARRLGEWRSRFACKMPVAVVRY
jgi:hypothetical protein